MKKSFVALGVAAVLAGATGGAFAANSIAGAGTATTVAATTNTATAATDLALSESGIGNILFVPYFNAVGGNATLLNLVNTDAINGKALKVRFRGASNSDDIFDFTLFLSPGDVWAGKVSKGADGRAKLETSDNSITLPANVNQAFVTDRLPTNFTAEQKAAQTLEGYIEILNVANVPATYRPTGSTALVANPLYTAIKHVNGVAPGTTTAAGKAAIDNLRNPLATQANAVDAGFDAPTGGLFANWTLIDLANASVAWSGEATAVTTVGGAGRIVFSPQLGGAVSNDLANVLTADPLLRQSATGNPITALADPAVTPQYFDFPDLSTPYTGAGALNTTSPLTQANNLSQSLAVTSIANEFLTDDSISAATDWSFSIPTRRYGVAVKYAASAPLYTAVFNTLATTTSPAVIGDANTGFASAYFTSSNSKLGTGADAHKVVISTGSTSPLTAFDRSENSKQSDFVISPSTAAAVDFPGEVSVLSFNAGGTAAGSVLGAAITRKDIDVTYQDGWASIATPGLTAIGLPIVGHAFTRAVGPAVAGKSTNFGTTARHRFTR